MKIKIQEYLNKNDLSGYLVSKLSEDQVSCPSIYDWINGKHQPSWASLDLLCEVLNCTMDDLFEAEKGKLQKPSCYNCIFAKDIKENKLECSHKSFKGDRERAITHSCIHFRRQKGESSNG